MMFAVNLTGICITALSFFGEVLSHVWGFIYANPIVIVVLFVTALISACAQLTIFYVIREFGPLVLAIIMLMWYVVFDLARRLFLHRSTSVVAVVGATVMLGVIAKQTLRVYYDAEESSEVREEIELVVSDEERGEADGDVIKSNEDEKEGE